MEASIEMDMDSGSHSYQIFINHSYRCALTRGGPGFKSPRAH